MSDTQLLLYDKNYYDLAKTEGFDKDRMDYENNGKKVAANRGVMTNTLDYGESLNPVYGSIMDLISGKARLPKGAIGNVSYKESSYSNSNSKKSNMMNGNNLITESMLVASLGGRNEIMPVIEPTPPPPRPIKKPQAVVAPAPGPTPPLSPEGPKPGGGGGALPGGGDVKEDEKKEEAPVAAPSKPNYLAIGIGALVGAIGGYMYAAKTGKSAIAFGIGGAAIGAGAGWAVGKYALEPKATTTAATEEKKFCGCGA
jgi:hypothetical protein